MKMLWRMLSRLRSALSGHRPDCDLAEEFESHIEMQTEDNIRAGMRPGEARRAAVLKFGGLESIKESYRDQRGIPLIESLLHDVRYALRQLRRTPGFTVTVVAAIALGIGANTAIFTVVNAFLFKPLPVPDAHRLVVLGRTSISDSGETNETASASPAAFMHWRAQSSVIEDVSAFLRTAMNYTGKDAIELWQCMQVSADIFHALRMPVLQGRTFTADEDLPDGPRVAVISQGIWRRRFASDPQIVGKEIPLNGEPYTVVGVVADSRGLLEFEQSSPTDVYIPFAIDPNTTDVANSFYVAARLKPGVTIEQAKARLSASASEFRAKFPITPPKNGFTLRPFRELTFSQEDRPRTMALIAAVNMVLLIACANVVNLMLVRSIARRREIGIRIAIGARRSRVIRQLLTESLVLSLAGGALGLFLGDLGIRTLLAASFTDWPLLVKLDLDWRVLAFSFAVSATTGMIFGLLPALQGSRLDVNSVLKDSGGPSGAGLRQNKLRAALVISEVTLAVVLLAGSALLIRSLIKLYRVDRGFETRNVLLMYTSLTGSKYSTASHVAETVRDGLSRVRTLPGVLAAGAAAYAPLQGSLTLNFTIAGQPAEDTLNTTGAGWVTVSPEYFDVFKIPLKRGRVFDDRDDGKSPPVVLINEAMAKKFWKDGDPLKDRIIIGHGIGKTLDGDQPRQIVGIVGDVRQNALDVAPNPRMYVPQAQLPDATNAWLVNLAPNAWVVRTQTETHQLSTKIQEQLRQSTGLPVFEMHSMNQIVSSSTEDKRFMMVLMTIFACLALLLASIGIYAVVSYSVSQQTHEIGIRLALGAESTQVRNMVVRHGIAPALTGMALGIPAAWGLGRFMESFLFGVRAHDPIVFFSVPVVLTAVALFAVWLPANRASRVNPVDALRHE